jgi:hypothetical protein
MNIVVPLAIILLLAGCVSESAGIGVSGSLTDSKRESSHTGRSVSVKSPSNPAPEKRLPSFSNLDPKFTSNITSSGMLNLSDYIVIDPCYNGNWTSSRRCPYLRITCDKKYHNGTMWTTIHRKDSRRPCASPRGEEGRKKSKPAIPRITTMKINFGHRFACPPSLF